MKDRLIITICAAALFLLLISCSSSTEEKVFQSYTVEIRGMQFQPAALSVKRGDTVVFINKDIVVHDVTEEGNKAWASPPLSMGQSYSLVVWKSANYYCTIHPVMKGRLLAD